MATRRISDIEETTFMFKVFGGAKRTRTGISLDDEADMECYHVITTWSQPPKLKAPPAEIAFLSCEITVADGPQLWTSTVLLAKLISGRPKGVTAELHARLSLCALTGQPDPENACEPFMEVKLPRSEASLMFREIGNALKISLDTPESRIVLKSLRPDTAIGRSKWKTWLDFFMDERKDLKNHIIQARSQISSIQAEKRRLNELLKGMETNRATEEASLYTQFKDVLNKKKKKIYLLTRQMERLQAAKVAGSGLREQSPAENGEGLEGEESEEDKAPRREVGNKNKRSSKRKRSTTPPSNLAPEPNAGRKISGRRKKVSSERESEESESEFEFQKSDVEEEDPADNGDTTTHQSPNRPTPQPVPRVLESAASPPSTTDDEPMGESRSESHRDRPEAESMPLTPKTLPSVPSSSLFSVTAASLEPRFRDERAPVIKRRRRENTGGAVNAPK